MPAIYYRDGIKVLIKPKRYTIFAYGVFRSNDGNTNYLILNGLDFRKKNTYTEIHILKLLISFHTYFQNLNPDGARVLNKTQVFLNGIYLFSTV